MRCTISVKFCLPSLCCQGSVNVFIPIVSQLTNDRASQNTNRNTSQLCALCADCHNAATTDPEMCNNIERRDLAMQLAIGCCTEGKLLQETEVDSDTFVRIMQANETAALFSAALHSEPAATIAAAIKGQPPTHRNSNQRSTSSRQYKARLNISKACLGCGKTGHAFKSVDCPATGKTCFHCGNLNHFATACLRKANGKKSIHRVQLGTVSSSASSPTPDILVELSVSHGHTTTTLNSMVDTGADISTIQKSTFQRHFAQCAAQPMPTTVRNFDGSPVTNLHGMFTATVRHGDRQTDANLYIVADNLPSVACMSWSSLTSEQRRRQNNQ